MWKCLNCGAEFESPTKECFDYSDGICWKLEYYCPECHVDDIEPLHLCRCERNYIPEERDRCDQCEQEINEIMSESRERIKNARNVDHQQSTEDIVWWVEREG